MSHVDGAIPYADARRALWSVVAGEARRVARQRRPYRKPLWSQVGALCGLGSTSAWALCKDMGFHPETGEVERERGWELPAPVCRQCGGRGVVEANGGDVACGLCPAGDRALEELNPHAAAGGAP